jgi:hypothetical protein
MIVVLIFAGVAFLLVRTAKKFRLKKPSPFVAGIGVGLFWLGFAIGINFLGIAIGVAAQSGRSELVGFLLGTALLHPVLGWTGHYVLGGPPFRHGLMRLWIIISGIWIIFVFASQARHIFWEVHADDFFGYEWLPWWASLRTHVQLYADPTLGMHPNPPDTILTPSHMLIAARIGDMTIGAILPPLVILVVALGMRRVVAGFRQTNRLEFPAPIDVTPSARTVDEGSAGASASPS